MTNPLGRIGLLAFVGSMALLFDAPARAADDSSSASGMTTSNVFQQKFVGGATLSYGVTLSLLRLSSTRPSNAPGRTREYTPGVEVLPAEFGFQFTYGPQSAPWRFDVADPTKPRFQLMTVGGVILGRVDDRARGQGNISLAATLGFFENAISIGVGVDLYRGIPIQGANGAAGAGTAHTGILAWAFSPEGEVTPENIFVLLSLSLSRIVGSVSGQVSP